VLITLGALFVGLTVWHNPTDAGNSTGDFIGNVASWAQDAFDKASEFSESVIE
jgi:hypothetical protein